MDKYGLPVDRSICPACRGFESSTGRGCVTCGGSGSVCPTCRGGRVMSSDGPRIGYRVCADCCFREDGFGPTGYPKYTRNPGGERNAILTYRAQLGRAQDAA